MKRLNQKTKRLAIVGLFVFVGAMALSSCATTNRTCPAYSKTYETEKADQERV